MKFDGLQMQIRDDGAGLNFSHLLLDPVEILSTSDFASCLNARGLYESQRFALRLNPVIHALVDSMVEKAENGETTFSGEELQAYSTYVHETIHWWQHKGSTSGFIRSLLYPIQTHANMENLRSLLTVIGPQKSMKSIGLQGELGLLHEGASAGPLANQVVNNFMDTEFYLALTSNPRSVDVQIYENPYFEAAGHSFLITYGHVLGALRNIFDDEGRVIPDPGHIEENLIDLRAREVLGYYYASPIIRAPLGLYQLFEGQARFIQLQFLSFACGGLSFHDAREMGMLEAVYGEAFQIFLRLTESSEPLQLNDPLVALFLLVCDLSINPTAGFPSAIEDYESFFLDADPGIRFARLCRAICEELPELRSFIVGYSGDEYRTAVRQLCAAIECENYLDALEKINSWEAAEARIADLIEEHRKFEFQPDNIVPRVLFGEFLQFSKDKLTRPEFFCWPGYWLTHGRGRADLDLWLKHLSLFSDREDDGRIFARKIPGREEEMVLEVFNQFFAAVVLYWLTKQWVLNDGPFKLDFSWLVLPRDEDEFIKKINAVFKKHYGVDLDDFVFVSPPSIPRRNMSATP